MTVQPAARAGNVAGDATRRAILAALLDREPQTIRGLAKAAGTGYMNARYHLDILTRAGLLEVDRRRGRAGSRVCLTAAGREAGA